MNNKELNNLEEVKNSSLEMQHAIEAVRLEQYGASKSLTPGAKSLIYTLACVEWEEAHLQNFCNSEGTCYQVTGKSGDVYSRMRPEWQQLKEARMRKQAIIARLEKWAGEGVDEEDELKEFLR
jgi:hypothetical protein